MQLESPTWGGAWHGTPGIYVLVAMTRSCVLDLGAKILSTMFPVEVRQGQRPMSPMLLTCGTVKAPHRPRQDRHGEGPRGGRRSLGWTPIWPPPYFEQSWPVWSVGWLGPGRRCKSSEVNQFLLRRFHSRC